VEKTKGAGVRCFSCGADLEGTPEVCPRCYTRISSAQIRRHLLITVAYALVAIGVVAVVTLLVLIWQDAHIASGV